MERSPRWESTVPDHLSHAAPPPAGTQAPKARMPLAVFALSVVFFLEQAGGARNFFVSPVAIHVMAWPSVLLSLLLCAALVVKQRQVDAPVAGGPIVNGILLVLLFLLSVLVLLDVFPRVANGVVGKGASSTFTIVAKAHEPSGRRHAECYRLDLQELQTGWTGRLCASAADYDAARAGEKAVIYGKRSWFGMKASRIALAPGK